jgi:hypothetical protein
VKRIFFLLVILPCAAACFAQVDTDVSTRVAVLASPDARSKALERDRLVRELRQIVSVLHVNPQRLPNIVIVYAGEDSARIDALPAGAKVTVARITIADGFLYQVWITGAASDANAVQGMIWVLNRHFELHLAEPVIADVRDRVVKQMSDIVSVNALTASHR